MPRPPVVADQVLAAMRGSDRHCWTLDELQGELAAGGRSPNPSSVFRAVGALERDGAVVRVDLGDGRGHYEVTGSHHDHLRCDACGRVEPLACSIVEDLAGRVRKRSGFVISGHRLVLSGTCGTCVGAPGGDRP